MNETIEVGKHKYHTHPMLQVGDYGGAGSVGFGNIAFLKHLFPDQIETSLFEIEQSHQAPPQNDLLILNSQFGGISAFLKDGKESKILESLEKYPALDDEYVSRVEGEWVRVAVNEMRGYFENRLPEKLAEKSEKLTEEQFLVEFWRACESSEYTPVMEHSSAFIEESRVNEALVKTISGMKIRRDISPECPGL